MSSIPALLDFRHREFATFMKARGSLPDTLTAPVHPLPATRPTSPDPTPYNCSSASLSSPATSSQCKSSLCRRSEKPSPTIVQLNHPHTLPSLALQPIPHDARLPPLTAPTQPLNRKLPPALQCILNSPLPSTHPNHPALSSAAVGTAGTGNTSMQPQPEHCALRKRPRPELVSSSPPAPTKMQKIDHPSPSIHNGSPHVSPHVSPTTITNLARIDSSKSSPFFVRPLQNRFVRNDAYCQQLSVNSKFFNEPAPAPVTFAANPSGSSSRRHYTGSEVSFCYLLNSHLASSDEPLFANTVH